MADEIRTTEDKWDAKLCVEFHPTTIPRPIRFGVMVGHEVVACLSLETVEAALHKFHDMAAKRAMADKKFGATEH